MRVRSRQNTWLIGWILLAWESRRHLPTCPSGDSKIGNLWRWRRATGEEKKVDEVSNWNCHSTEGSLASSSAKIELITIQIHVKGRWQTTLLSTPVCVYYTCYRFIHTFKLWNLVDDGDCVFVSLRPPQSVLLSFIQPPLSCTFCENAFVWNYTDVDNVLLYPSTRSVRSLVSGEPLLGGLGFGLKCWGKQDFKTWLHVKDEREKLELIMIGLDYLVVYARA